MGQTVKAQFQSNVIDGTVGSVQQRHGIVQSALQHILVQRHARMLEHQLVQIIGIVIQIRTDLHIGDAPRAVGIDILVHLTHHIIVDVAQLLVAGQK